MREIIIALAMVLMTGCASTLHFLFDVDPDLTYNDQEKKWEQKEKIK
ncbi:hypothetical protein LCGC14_1214730 [marine sediment metagenome]|uniref:Lipoprotein n=1 Tax=marine sediment metagenome TaxID=412755 RepID=A0A0F9LH73_9ZZZZ